MAPRAFLPRVSQRSSSAEAGSRIVRERSSFEDGHGVSEADSMFGKVRASLSGIPLVAHKLSICTLVHTNPAFQFMRVIDQKPGTWLFGSSIWECTRSSR